MASNVEADGSTAREMVCKTAEMLYG